MRGLPTLTLASVRMIYRSPASLRVAFVTPVMMAAMIALFHELRFQSGTRQVDFFSYLAVGVAFWYVAYAAAHGMTGAAAGYRAQGVLKRIAVAPISSRSFIAAQALARVGLGVTQIVVLLAVARLLGAQIKLDANFAWALVPTTMIVLAALSIGFIWAGITRTPGGANTLDVMSAVPLLFLSGGMWPRSGYAPVVQHITDYAIPYVPMADMLRGVALHGTSITHDGHDLLLGTIWVVALFAIAARAYRLKED